MSVTQIEWLGEHNSEKLDAFIQYTSREDVFVVNAKIRDDNGFDCTVRTIIDGTVSFHDVHHSFDKYNREELGKKLMVIKERQDENNKSATSAPEKDCGQHSV